MKEVLHVVPQKFRPSIPNLVYQVLHGHRSKHHPNHILQQYDLYTNYASAALQLLNPEVDDGTDSYDTGPAHQGSHLLVSSVPFQS